MLGEAREVEPRNVGPEACLGATLTESATDQPVMGQLGRLDQVPNQSGRQVDCVVAQAPQPQHQLGLAPHCVRATIRTDVLVKHDSVVEYLATHRHIGSYGKK